MRARECELEQFLFYEQCRCNALSKRLTHLQVSSEIYEAIVISEARILREVGELVFTLRQVGRVVDRDNVLVLSDIPNVLSRGDVLSFLDDPSVEVIVGDDLVQRRQDDALRVRALENGSDERLDELFLVNVHAGPCGGAEEDLVVLGA